VSGPSAGYGTPRSRTFIVVFQAPAIIAGVACRQEREVIMSETQSINDTRAVNSVTEAPAFDVKSATAAKAASLVETLRELGTAWAGAAVGYGKVALENAAHALERTAEKLGTLQEKLKKGDAPVITVAH
jgi:diphthamide synthase (EF-2-diphthine--ammonia ligase)